MTGVPTGFITEPELPADSSYGGFILGTSSTARSNFQARRYACRQEVERMERRGINIFKYRCEDVGNLQDPFRTLVQRDKESEECEVYNAIIRTQGEKAMIGRPALESVKEAALEAPRPFSFEADDLYGI
ncbi:hypothetical protein SBOR_3725 [Sclerotinia borealis F-4128]|uniref:Uncharacterized protein n=1 Tax=Sclerotinia borealis (strain F-4128) TaxID=1432307 RepID=W9CGR9_SCLBF|nr:hypothetical protein SBOR_3725 [Sclerotinia borealis F-4128]